MTKSTLVTLRIRSNGLWINLIKLLVLVKSLIKSGHGKVPLNALRSSDGFTRQEESIHYGTLYHIPFIDF